MPTKNRHAIYEYLFKEGVLVAKKDFQAPKHPEIDVPNLQVIKTLQVEYVTLNIYMINGIHSTRTKSTRPHAKPYALLRVSINVSVSVLQL